MSRVVDLLQRDFKRPIEEIIKVNNADEETVYCAVRVFEITKDKETRETDVTVTEGESDEALRHFLDYHSG
jgi:hypothetical protein